ncbi:MAG: prohibitin family protein [Gracilibacteraceae bacterium]|nr:prohibitin family protein [Gracilibacteraceae bacterium]
MVNAIKIPTKKNLKFWLPVSVILFVFVIVLLFQTVVIIQPGYCGAVIQLGQVQEYVFSEGLHTKVPFIQSVKPMEVRVQKIETKQNASSRDLQIVNTVIAVNYHLDASRVNWLFKEVGVFYSERVLDPAIAESLKAVTAQYTAEELISKRSEVSLKIKETLSDKLETYYMVLDEVNLTEFQFSAEFNDAIEKKQVAEQQVLKATLDLQRIEIEAKQKIEQAKAEAESLRLQKQEVTPELVELRKIEAQMEAIRKWDGKMPTVTGGALPFIDINSL